MLNFFQGIYYYPLNPFLTRNTIAHQMVNTLVGEIGSRGIEEFPYLLLSYNPYTTEWLMVTQFSPLKTVPNNKMYDTFLDLKEENWTKGITNLRMSSVRVLKKSTEKIIQRLDCFEGEESAKIAENKLRKKVETGFFLWE